MIKNVFSNTINGMSIVMVLCLSAFIYCTVEGQEVWTTNEFLAYDTDMIALPYEENLKFLNNTAKGMPLVDNYEFRTETNEMNLERQQYQFRFQLNSKDERKAYDRILLANKERYSLLQAKYELEIWKEKYKNIIDIYFLQKEEELIKQEYELLIDKKTVLLKLLESRTQINIENWIGNENDLFNSRLDSIDLELQKKEVAQRVFKAERPLPYLNDSDFIQVETLKNRVLALLQKDSENPEKEMAEAERNIAEAEYELEKAEGNKWLNFAQIEYQSDDKVSFQREVALSTSITIPNKGNNRVKKNDAALELLDKTYKSRLEAEKQRRSLLFEESKLLSLIDQYQEFKLLRSSQELDSMFNDFSESKIVSPLVLIRIKQSILKNEKKQLNLKKDIYESYINFLTLKAAFLSEPKINYLSE